MAKPAFEVVGAEYCFVAYTNEDGTEGRGREYPIAVSWNEETAKRIGKGRYIMGSDCPVKKQVAVKVSDGSVFGEQWLAPVKFETPTKEDEQKEAQKWIDKSRKQRRDEAIKRAKDLGLSDDDLKALSD